MGPRAQKKLEPILGMTRGVLELAFISRSQS
jgi:hypothetical protein